MAKLEFETQVIYRLKPVNISNALLLQQTCMEIASHHSLQRTLIKVEKEAASDSTIRHTVVSVRASGHSQPGSDIFLLSTIDFTEHQHWGNDSDGERQIQGHSIIRAEQRQKQLHCP